ncbi:MAG: TOBE domain-containing protein [Haloferacaceae archaeon]
MDADFEARLRADDVAFTERDAALLREIDGTGSLNRAAAELGRSYSRAHGRLTVLEEGFGPLVERQRGGSGGGGSALTDRARELIARFDRLRAGYTSVAETSEAVLAGVVEERSGELGTVRTDAGPIRAIVPPEGDAVQVSIRADAVTLHAPGDSPADGATSARNRFEGHVVALERGEAVSHVTVDVGADDPLFALVTEASRRRLDLGPGTAVVASFKATATRATAGESPSDDCTSTMPGD